MLKTLVLRNYRGFKSYRLDDLTKVNLIVGKNNSGKTSILEAVELLVAEAHLSVFYESARRRGEFSSYDRRGPRPDISHLFFGHDCQPGACFELSSDNENQSLTVRVLSLDEVGEVDWQSRSYGPDEQPEPAFAISIVSGTRKKDTVILVAEDGSIMHRPSVFMRYRSIDKAVHFVGLESLATATMGKAWNRLLADGQESEVVKDMELLLPDIDSIQFLTGGRVSGRGILVGRRGTSRRVPIGSYGDGVRRLLAFRLALVGTANGFLLIDEIDAGLHWTVMEDVWRLLVEVAARTNVQVFATTHSYDCIRGLGTLVRSSPGLGEYVSIHKLDRLLKQSVTLRGEHIPVAVKQEIEVR